MSSQFTDRSLLQTVKTVRLEPGQGKDQDRRPHHHSDHQRPCLGVSAGSRDTLTHTERDGDGEKSGGQLDAGGRLGCARMSTVTEASGQVCLLPRDPSP